MLGHVVDDFPAEDLALHVGSAKVQPRPDPGPDDFPERQRKAVEVAQFAGEAGTCHVETGPVAEELLQHLQIRPVASEVSRRMLRVGRRQERRPCEVGLSCRVTVLVRPLDRSPRSPEVPVGTYRSSS